MEDNKILKLVYTFFVGILLALFIGIGINTFYPGPKAPEYPETSMVAKEPIAPNEEQQKAEKAYQLDFKTYQEQENKYSRNVSIIALAGAVLLLTASIIFERKIKLIADGIMLGGLFTLLYSLGRSFASQDSKYSFMAISIGLALVLYIGYHRFVKHEQRPKKK